MRTDKEILGLTYRQHIGGRWAVSWLMYVLNLPLTVLAVLSNAPQMPTLELLPAWLFLGVTGYIALGVVLYVANVTVLRHRRMRPVPVWLVVLVGAVAGAARGLVVGLLANAFDLSEPNADTVTIRVLTGALIGAVLIPLAALFLSIIATYIARRRQLIATQHALAIARMRTEGVSEGLRRAFVEALKEDLHHVASQQDPELVRAMSRRIWESTSASTPEPRLRVRQVLRTSIESNPYSVWPVVIIWGLVAWGSLSLAIGIPRTVGQILASAAGLWVLYWFGRRSTRHSPRHASIIFISVAVAAVVLTGPLAYVLFDDRPVGQALNLMLLNSVWLPFFMIVVAIVSGAVHSSEDVIAKLSALVSAEEIQALAAMSEEAEIRRDVATRLHGSVQARLLASAALMRQPDLLRQMGHRNPANVLLEFPELQGDFEDDRSFEEQLTAVIRPWSALMEVTVNVKGGPVPAPAISMAGRVIEEALANAFRHGHAAHVEVTIRVGTASVRITIVDDGTGLVVDRSSGMGSALLDVIAPQRWSLEEGIPSGAALEVELPLGH